MILETITFENYITQVKLSNSRKPTYYGKLDAVPRKYKEADGTLRKGYQMMRFTIRRRGRDSYVLRLCKNGLPVQKNINSDHKPRYATIGGNAIYSGDPILRGKVVSAIKEHFTPAVNKLVPFSIKYPGCYPLAIRMLVIKEAGKGDWDLDNLWIYYKCFQDVLVEQGVIDGDTIKYIKQVSFQHLDPINEQVQPRLQFTISTHYTYDKEETRSKDRNAL